MGNRNKFNYLLWLLIIIPYLAIIPAYWWYNKVLGDTNNATFIVISKQSMRLELYSCKGKLLQTCNIACGKNAGNKNAIGDMKTPEGIFNVADIEDASTWAHDFNDGNGAIKNAYGPYFIRLNVPGQKGIGIHGTHAPQSIGTRVTEGCIRIPNGELEKLVKRIKPSTVVIITPSQSDIDSTAVRAISHFNN